MFCPQCGTPSNDAAFCPSCGASITGSAAPAHANNVLTPNGSVDSGTGLTLSGWWRRVGATVIDSLVILIPSRILVAVHVPAAISEVLMFAYLYYFWTSRGTTLGNLATGTRVVSENGGSIESNSAAIRGLVICLPQLVVSIVSGASVGSVATGGGLSLIVGVFYLVNYLMPLWDGRKQAIHDKAAKTLVVRA